MAKLLPHPFQPMEEEPYMILRQVNYFRTRLIKWRREVAVSLGSKDLLLREEMDKAADWIDHAADRAQRILLFAGKENSQNILKEIDAALIRIEGGTFGYCEESGEEIGIRRLTVYPIAKLSVEAQERMEHRRRRYGAGTVIPEMALGGGVLYPGWEAGPMGVAMSCSTQEVQKIVEAAMNAPGLWLGRDRTG